MHPVLRCAVVCLSCLGLGSNAGCGGSDARSNRPRPALDPASDPRSPEAAVRKLEKTPDQTMRVLLTVRVDKVTAETAKARVAKVLRDAGAERVEPVEAQPLLIVEAKAAPIRAALATGHIARVRIDAPTKSTRVN